MLRRTDLHGRPLVPGALAWAACALAGLALACAPASAAPPVAVGEGTIALDEDAGPVVVDVLANDMDPEGGALDIVGVSQTRPGLGTARNMADHIVYEVARPDVNSVIAGGLDEVTYTVRDPAGETAQASFLVHVRPVNDLPSWSVGAGMASITVPEDPDQMVPPRARSHAIIGFAISISAGPPSATDEADDPLVFVVAPSDPGFFEPAGQPIVTSDGELRFTTARDRYGTTTLQVRLRDGHGTPETTDDVETPPVAITLEVTPTNDAPVARDDEVSMMVGAPPVRIAVLGNDDVGPDAGDVLRLAPGAGGAKVTQPPAGQGSVTVAGDEVEYAPTGFTGTVSFAYTIDDWGGAQRLAPGPLESTAMVRVRVLGLGDLGVPDAYTTPEDTPLSVPAHRGVLANDRRPTGSSATARLDQDASHGTVTLRADGGFDYRPDGDYHGRDSFSYRVVLGDGTTGGSTLVDLLVASRNDPPVAAPDQYRVWPGQPTRILAPDGVLANDVDVDGEALQAVLDRAPRHGRVELGLDGGFLYTPPAGFEGDDAWSYRVRDPSGSGGVASVKMVVRANQAPTVDFEADAWRVPMGVPVKFRSLAADPDGILVSWRWEFGNGAEAGVEDPVYVFGVPGEYRVRLTVTDDARSRASREKVMLVTAGYTVEEGGAYAGGVPVADAGADRLVLGGSLVQLDGSGGDGGRAIGFTWTQTGGPPVRLSDPDRMRPIFQAPTVAAGESVRLEFQLVLFDAYFRSLPDTVRITVRDTLLEPVADAGNDLQVTAGGVVTLRGRAVGFPPETQVHLQWVQTDGPPVGLGLPGANVTFRAPSLSEAAVLRFTLHATGAGQDAVDDAMAVTVVPARTPGGFLHRPGAGHQAQAISFQAVLLDVVATGLEWDFGDGNTSRDVAPTHRYARPGTFVVTLRVQSEDGQTTVFEQAIDVHAAPDAAPGGRPMPAPWGALGVAAAVWWAGARTGRDEGGRPRPA